MKNTKKQFLLTNDTIEGFGWTNFTTTDQQNPFHFFFKKTKMGVEFELTFSEVTYDVLICRGTPFNKEVVFKGRVFNPGDFMSIDKCIFNAIE